MINSFIQLAWYSFESIRLMKFVKIGIIYLNFVILFYLKLNNRETISELKSVLRS
jgi:hypothetical protein